MNRDDLKSTIEKLYTDILINLDVNKIDTYFAPSYVQTTDHQTSDINEFTDHLKKLKEVVARLSIEEFKTCLLYTSDAAGVFNEDGKVITCKELTLPYNEELNGIGSVK